MDNIKKNSIISDKDILILKQLLEDGRKSSACISKEIDLGREIVNYRIKRLIRENLIVKFVPKINENAVHYKEYLILLKLNLEEDGGSKEEFIKQSIGNKYLVWVVKSDSGWDLIIRLYAESLEEFQLKLAEILDSYSDVLADYYTIITSQEIKESEKEAVFEKVFDEDLKDRQKKDFKVLKSVDSNLISIDNKDKEILRLLEGDARLQYKEIAEKLEISSDTVKYRIDKMKDSGVIENFMPVINFSKLGFFQYASILRFKFLDKVECEKVAKFLLAEKSIIRAIKNLNSNEYFITQVFSDLGGIVMFKKRLEQVWKEKIEKYDCFEID